jgi:RNA-splicing ligase RtcB
MQLACMPFNSPEGQAYFSAMNSAANYAFANRQILGFLTADTYKAILWSLLEGSGLQAYLRFSPQHSQVGKA